MKFITLILLIFIQTSNIFGLTCIEDNRSLSERLFLDNQGTIFTCRVLSVHTPQKNYSDIPTGYPMIESESDYEGTATAEVIEVYFGKVNSKLVTMLKGNYLAIGETLLIYSGSKNEVFSFGGSCDKWDKIIKNNDLKIQDELRILNQFSKIFAERVTGTFTFKNSLNIVIAQGNYEKGKPIGMWKHYYDSGITKTIFDLENNETSEFGENGYIKSRLKINKKKSFYESFSKKIDGTLEFTFLEIKNDSGSILTVTEYYVNGHKKVISSQANINVKGGSTSTGKLGLYEEFYETGSIKVKGKYAKDKQVGKWKWFNENGKLEKVIDFTD